MGVTDLIDQDTIQSGLDPGLRRGNQYPAHGLPAALPIHPLDEGVHQPLFGGGQGQRQQ